MDYQIFNEDCLEGMKRIETGSVDMILTDLPYNLTDCAWDKGVIDLPTLWTEFKRILKPCCSAVLFASGKFTHKLIASNFDWYKYKWIWVKNAPTMFVQAKNAPMRKFEEICVFSDGVIYHESCTNRRMKYNPQGVVPCEYYHSPHKGANVATRGIFKVNDGKDKPTQLRAGGRGERWRQDIRGVDDCGNRLHANKNARVGDVRTHGALKKFQGIVREQPSNVDWYIQEQTGYPSDILTFNVVPNTKRGHPTQKPVDLLEYLIKTYTNEGELVLDATMGSGSTGVAAMNTGRRFIGFETEQKFFDVAQKRIDEAIAKREQSLF